MQYTLDIQTICVDGSVIVDPFGETVEAGGVTWDIASRDPAEITGTSAAGALLRLTQVPAGIEVKIDGVAAGTYLRPDAVPDDRLRDLLVAVVRDIRAVRTAAQREGRLKAAATMPARLERTIAALDEPGLYGPAPATAPLPPSRLFETGRARGFALGDAVVRVAIRSLRVESRRTGASMWINDVDRRGRNTHGDVTASISMWEPRPPVGSDARLTRRSFDVGKVTISVGPDGAYEVTGDEMRVARAVASLVGPLAARQAPYLARLDAIAAAERAERAAAHEKRRAAEEAERAARAPIEAARQAEAARAQAIRDTRAQAERARVARLANRL